MLFSENLNKVKLKIKKLNGFLYYIKFVRKVYKSELITSKIQFAKTKA